MIFNSTTFVVFFVAFLALYWMVPTRWRNAALLVGSYLFYGWWDWRFLGLLAVSTLVDFSIARGMESAPQRRRKQLLGLSLVVNLGILSVFKYFNFFVDSFADLSRQIGISPSPVILEVVLPVGISFYTFQTLSYSFDVYRGRISATRSLLNFATYVAYFPQLVAGPIERAQRLLPLIEDAQSRVFPRQQRLSDAASLILLGLFKKVVLADGVASIVNAAYDDPTGQSTVAMWTAVLAFSIQIYGDFSGYSDIARGVSALLGIDLMVNFREPYLSRNITEFWRRWHISLSDWLRDYVYISFGGNRNGTSRTYRNLMLTMFLGGLWHGASWTFVFWGCLHGFYLVLHRLFFHGTVPDESLRVRQIPRVAATFLLVSLTWVFFRAASFGDAFEVLQRCFRFTDGTTDHWDVVVVLVAATAMFGLDLATRATALQPERVPRFRTGLLPACLACAVLVFSGGAPAPFIYFQF